MPVMDTPKIFIAALRGQKTDHIPFWLMRQAGRYLPEYRAIREEAGGFLKLALDPEKAAEVTIQPLRRFDMDAAILFSDILMVPMALGKDLRFETGEGPVLEKVRSVADIPVLDHDDFHATLDPVYETVRRVRAQLVEEGFDGTALIGFAGSPWTVATYMVEGGSSPDRKFTHTKTWAQEDPEGFTKLIAVLTEATIAYLSRQIEAGAEAVQLFDSWASTLQGEEFAKWVIAPTAIIARALKEKYPHIPLIGFPRGAGLGYRAYARDTGVDAVGLDQGVPFALATELQEDLPVQGNLDPELLRIGGDRMKAAAEKILEALGQGPFVFNLGHGVIKETPPDHVGQLAGIIKSWR